MKRFLPLLLIAAIISTSCVSKKKFTELESENGKLENSVMSLKESVSELQTKVEDLNQMNGELEKEKDALDDNLSGVMNKVSQTEKDLEAMKKNLDQKQYQLNQMWTSMESAFSTVEAAAAESDARIKQLESFLYLDFNESFTFNSGSEAVLKENKATLTKIADMMKRNPGVTLVVEGHADKRGIVSGRYQDNLELSVSRASNVIRELIKMGVEPRQLIASGRGESIPIAEGSTAAELRPNRRAEFIVVPNVGKIYKVMQENKGK
jgi:chemotaxis protein MotB